MIIINSVMWIQAVVYTRCGMEVLVRFQSESHMRPIELVVVSTRLDICNMCIVYATNAAGQVYKKKRVARCNATSLQQTQIFWLLSSSCNVCYRIRVRTAAAAPNNKRKHVAQCMNTSFEAIQISIHIICNIDSL